MMDFMIFKTIVLQNEKKNTLTSDFFSFYSLFVTWSGLSEVKNDIILSTEGGEMLAENLTFLNISLRLYWPRHGFFTKESKIFFDFCHI